MSDKGTAIAKLARADLRTKDLVETIQTVLAKDTFELNVLKDSLIALLEYLSSAEGRTEANCKAVDSFFMFDDLWVKRNLPDPFHDIFADISGALHDTVSSPEIAENFGSTPEQLLKRARELNTERMDAANSAKSPRS